jgi:hypothetical protein
MIKGKKGSGRNGSRAKKREYKEHCRVMRTTGHVNDANGQWYRPIGANADAQIRALCAK